MDTRQNLSRFIDGDLVGEELDELLDRVRSNPALQAELADLYATRDAIRASLAGDEFSTGSGFTARVRAAIAADPEPTQASAQANVISIGTVNLRDADAQPQTDGGARSNRLVGFAIAASVALAAIAIGYRMLPPETLDTNAVSARIEPGQPSVTNVESSVAQLVEASTDSVTKMSATDNRSDRWDVRNHRLEERLKGYLVEHSEYVGRGMHGMHPYARVVSYQNDMDDPRINVGSR